MPALFYSRGDAAKRKSRRRQTKINELDTITGGFPPFQTVKIYEATQCALEGKGIKDESRKTVFVDSEKGRERGPEKGRERVRQPEEDRVRVT